MGATQALVPLAEYLSTTYEPDCDYVDGVLEERNLGTGKHSSAQAAIAGWLTARRRQLSIGVHTEFRIQVRTGKFRIPDVCVVRGKRSVDPYLTTAPFLCVEVLSPEDTFTRIQQRIDDYLKIGVPHIWVVDPEENRAWICTAEGNHQISDGILRTSNPDIAMPLAEVLED